MRSRLKYLIADYERETGASLTLLELAERTGVNINTLSRWGRPTPIARVDSDVAYALCKFFTTDLNHLLEFVPPAEN